MKKLIIILIIGITLSACGAPPRLLRWDDPVTINLWHYYHGVQEEALERVVAEFNTGEGLAQGIVVQPYSYGGVDELAQNIQASAGGAAGALAMPHIFSAYGDWSHELWEKGLLVQMEDYFSEEDLAGFEPRFLTEGQFEEDVVHILPVAKSTELLFLNKTGWDAFAQAVQADSAFEAVSLEDLKTWEGLIKTAKTYYEWTDNETPEPNDGKAFLGIDSLSNFGIIGLKQQGGVIADVFGATDDEVPLDEAFAQKLWDTYAVPVNRGYFASLGRFGSDDVKTGDLLAYVGASTSVAYFPQSIAAEDGGEAQAVELYVGTYPVFEGGTPFAAEQGAGMCISKSDERHETAAAVFLKWLTSEEVNQKFCYNTAGYYPVGINGIAAIAQEDKCLFLQETAAAENLEKVMAAFDAQKDSYTLYLAKPGQSIADLRAFFDAWKQNCRQSRERIVARGGDSSVYEGDIARVTGPLSFERWFFNLTTLNRK